jgi:hypothetical protein
MLSFIMDSFRTGKRFFEVNKNIGSEQQVKKIFSHLRVASLPVLPSNLDFERYLKDLKDRIREQDCKIKELQFKVEGVDEKKEIKESFKKIDVGYQIDMKSSSLLSPEQISMKKRNIRMDLNKQVEEKEKRKIREIIQKEKELRTSWETLKNDQINALTERKKNEENAKNYWNDLLVQQNIKEQVVETLLKDQELYQPLVQFRNLRSHGFNNDFPRILPEEALPKSKNLNPLASYSKLQAFKQPVYTKFHPKVMNRNPITGNPTFNHSYLT